MSEITVHFIYDIGNLLLVTDSTDKDESAQYHCVEWRVQPALNGFCFRNNIRLNAHSVWDFHGVYWDTVAGAMWMEFSVTFPNKREYGLFKIKYPEEHDMIKSGKNKYDFVVNKRDNSNVKHKPKENFDVSDYF